MSKSNLLKVSAAAGIAVIGVGIGSMLTPSLVKADDVSSAREDIYSKVVEKLGLEISAEELESAIKDSREEVMSEKLAESLQTAVDEGKITQEQADLAKRVQEAMHNYREENSIEVDRETLKEMTHEERQIEMESRKAEMQSAVAAEVGISVEELEELHNALKDAEVMPGSMGGGPRGHGRMGGQF